MFLNSQTKSMDDPCGKMSSEIPKTIYLTDATAGKRQLISHPDQDDELTINDCIQGSTTKRQRTNTKDRRLRWSRSTDLKDSKYADWKLHVRCFICNDHTEADDCNQISVSSRTTARDVATYVVHRSTLGIHSDYFERLFLSGFSEVSQGESTIELPVPTVTLAHFEDVLEYCYTGQIAVNPKNILCVISLSDYLGIHALKESSEADLQKDIQENFGGSKAKSLRMVSYYKDAKLVGMDDLQEAILGVCAEEPEILDKDCALASMPDIDFWHRLWEKRKSRQEQKEALPNSKIKMWSENLGYFFQKYPRLINLEQFRYFTHSEMLPVISAKIAVLLMEQEHRLHLEATKNNTDLDSNKNEASDDNSLTCLQTRCIDALYNTKNGGWQFYTDPILLRGRLRKLPSLVMETILLKTIEFETLGQNFPTPIVSFAGSDFINGFYTMSGWYQNAMKFTRTCMYEGKPRLFALYRYDGEWWISIIAEDHDEPGSNGDIDLYRVLMDEWEEESPLPPLTGWSIALGTYPAPMVRIASNGIDEMK